MSEGEKIEMGEIECGIYLNMPEEQYFGVRALSCSGMKHLAVSPLNYWHRNLNPERAEEGDRGCLRVGKAVHCRLLEPARFGAEYAAAPSPADYPDALVTTDDLKGWLGEHGLPVSAKRKEDLIARIEASGLEHPVIWDREQTRLDEALAGKTLLKRSEFDYVERMACAALADPFALSTLTGGSAEVSFVVRDPESGILLKARMDYVKPGATVDVKTFSNARGKPVDKAIFDAIFYENYHLQCVFYCHVREIARQQLADGRIKVHGDAPQGWSEAFAANADHRFGFVFIESDEPFDLRIIEMKPAEVSGGGLNVYWSAAAFKMNELMALYAECLAKYGPRPWRSPQPVHVLSDGDIPQLMFG